MAIQFPKDFLWGAATSAYQVEGGIVNDWTAYADAKEAADHYKRFKTDFALAKSLNHNAHRFSIEWSRIEPEEGMFDTEELAHYEQVLQELNRLKIEPVITLWHFTLPLWLAEKGGWTNPKTAEYFRRFTEFVVSNLGRYATYWVTLNEPVLYATLVHLTGKWLKKPFDPFAAFRTGRIMLRAHREAYHTIHHWQKRALVGVATNNSYFEPAGINPLNHMLASVAGYLNNHWFLERITQDFIGLNYYFHNKIDFGFNKNENTWVTDMGWEIYPKGIYHVIRELDRYKKPIIVTENGLADAKDGKREAFIKEHLYWIARAMEGGSDVRGYLHWSLIDNFEWADGFTPRFGLVEVNYKTQARKVRRSAIEYAKICKSGTLEGD